MAFDHLDHEVRIGDVLLDVVAFDLALVALGEHLFLHHAFADGSHLRTVFRVDDRSDDVAAEGRTDLVEKVFVRFADLLVLVVADLQCSAIGRQTALEGRGYARTEVAAYHGGTHQADLGFFLLEQVDQSRGVGQRSVRSQSLAVEHVQDVHSVLHDLFFDAFEVFPDDDGLQFATQTVGQRTAFGEQFETYLAHRAAFYLTIYK